MSKTVTTVDAKFLVWQMALDGLGDKTLSFFRANINDLIRMEHVNAQTMAKNAFIPVRSARTYRRRLVQAGYLVRISRSKWSICDVPTMLADTDIIAAYNRA